jgi:PAS domain S-box-containing protein
MRYAMALFFVATALLWSELLHPLLSSSFLVLFLIAVMASAWYGRKGPGLFAVLLSSIAAAYFFFPPIHSLRVNPETIPYFFTFLLGAITISWLSASRRKAEEAQQAHLDELVEQAPEAIMLIDLAGRVIRTNKEFSRMFGFAREEVIGRTGIELIIPTELQEQAVHFRQCLKRGDAVNLETVRKRKDGSLLSVWELGVPITVGRRRISYYLILRDISERKKAAEALRRVQAELAHLSRVTTMGELTASIAHEVNQPIGGIVAGGSAAMRWLSQEPPNTEEAREALCNIIQDANRAATVISRIRSLVKKSPPVFLELDLNKLIGGILVLAEGELREAGVILRTELGADLPCVLGDRIQLQQVMLNLVMNSIEAMREIHDRPRELVIESSLGSESLVVRVLDSGPGLQAEIGDHVFEPFVTTKPQGMGMGLSISRSIIEAHGGRLWVATHPQPGADFRFSLPASCNSDD